MRLLALDLGTNTGWASTAPELGIESGTQRFDLQRGESPGMRFLRFQRWLFEMIDMVKPEVIAFETPHHRGGAATEILVGMSTHIQRICAERQVEHTGVHTATLKKYTTGSGRASKEEMMKAAQRLFPEQIIVTDDQADALCVLKWAEHTLQID